MFIPGVRAQPHPHALFSLVAYQNSVGAKAVIAHNHHLVSVVPRTSPSDSDYPGGTVYGINVGFFIGNKSRFTIASIGRDGDIVVPVPASEKAIVRRVSRVQCSFEMQQQSEKLMLYDRSTSGTTTLIGSNVIPFELGRSPRRILMYKNVNRRFAIPGNIEFEIIWHEWNGDLRELIIYKEDNPRLTRTIDDTLTTPPTGRVTRIHTPACKEPKIRYTGRAILGKGSFGTVWKVYDVDSGDRIALKKIRWPQRGIQSLEYMKMKREVEILSKLSHVSNS